MQTAMQKLISQIKEEMTIDTIPKEWYYCLKSVIMSIEATYLEMEKKQIIKTGLDCGSFIETEDMEKYYNETYGSKGNEEISKVAKNTSFDKSSQTEISDEEIEKSANYFYPLLGEQSKKALWVNGCKWYREQLKKK